MVPLDSLLLVADLPVWIRIISLQNISQWTNDPDIPTIAALEEGTHTHSWLFFYLIFLMTKCLSETNGFIFLNPRHSSVSLCSSGPQGFRQLTKHILLLLCCLPTMLFTYRRMGGSVQQMNETAWISLTEPIEKFNCSSWSCPKCKCLMIQVPVPRIFTFCDQQHCILRYREWHH